MHETPEEMFSLVDHEDYVSCGAPSSQIATLPLEGKGAPPPDPQLSNYIPYFKHAKAQKGQIATLPLEGKGAPPPDPKLSNYIPYF